MKSSASQFNQLSRAELTNELAAAKRELFETSFQVGQGKEKRTHLPRVLRKKIAILNTLLAQPSTPQS